MMGLYILSISRYTYVYCLGHNGCGRNGRQTAEKQNKGADHESGRY